MAVFVLDKRKKPLMPCSEKRARLLLERGRARVHRLHPFTIRLTDRTLDESEVTPLRLKIDPGSKTLGLALVREDEQKPEAQVLHLAEVEHKPGLTLRLRSRAQRRRTRRGRKTRYRAPRFQNRTRPAGWLAPSLGARVNNVLPCVARYRKLAPIGSLSVEDARFDTQLMQDPDIQGAASQRGALYGYERWEYLLEKYRRTCQYCDRTDVPLTQDHVIPRSKGGSDRLSNLLPACRRCNQKKGNRSLEEFLSQDPDRLRRIRKRLRAPLRDAAALNSTRRTLAERLRATGLPVETGTGGRTKFNRTERGLPKTHALDALCVGESTPALLRNWRVPVLEIRVVGRGQYQRMIPDRYGFARGHRMRGKRVHGFASGDRVRAEVPRGKYQGRYVGVQVQVRSSGYFDLYGPEGVVAQGIPPATSSSSRGPTGMRTRSAAPRPAIPPATDS
jgi:5-methylcytosine-specific restriction endonuclease McrA